MNHSVDWRSLRLFLAVARAGSLRRAGAQLDTSGPTLGRQIERLERGLGQRLLERRQTGLSLTDAGQVLYGQALEMERIAHGIEQWWAGETPKRVVRISTGAWAGRFLARHINDILKREDNVSLEFITTPQRIDIARRQADIGLRNQRPDDPRLVTRRVHEVAFAPYRASDARTDLPWIAAGGDAAITPSARWVARENSRDIAVTTSDPAAVLDFVRAGIGQGVLPCFIGDTEPDLVRAGDPIDALKGFQWIVLNDQMRHTEPVRAIIRRLNALLDRNRTLFEGRLPAASEAEPPDPQP